MDKIKPRTLSGYGLVQLLYQSSHVVTVPYLGKQYFQLHPEISRL